MVIRLSIGLISFFLSPLNSFAQPTSNDHPNVIFPFLAEINQNQINIRAGQSTNFEKLCQINKGDEVIVLEQNFSWYKIRLPQHCQAYIIEKYIEKTEINKGKVIGQHVNIRAQANVESSSLGMLAKDTEVEILEKKEGWYKIKPPQNSFAWVAGQFVSFKSKDISLYQEPPTREIKTETIDQVKEQVSSLNEGMSDNLKEVSGLLEKSNHPMCQDCSYQLSGLGAFKYYLKTKLSLDEWIGQPVNVKGVLGNNSDQSFLDVYQIKLVH